MPLEQFDDHSPILFYQTWTSFFNCSLCFKCQCVQPFGNAIKATEIMNFNLLIQCMINRNLMIEINFI